MIFIFHAHIHVQFMNMMTTNEGNKHISQQVKMQSRSANKADKNLGDIELKKGTTKKSPSNCGMYPTRYNVNIASL